MIELHAVLTRKLGHSRATASRVLESLEVPVVPADATLVIRAASTAERHDISIFDAMIVEAAVLGGCEEVLSEDFADGAVLSGVRIVNPFRID
jgi:predicted nucleic acid-binding protein